MACSLTSQSNSIFTNMNNQNNFSSFYIPNRDRSNSSFSQSSSCFSSNSNTELINNIEPFTQSFKSCKNYLISSNCQPQVILPKSTNGKLNLGNTFSFLAQPNEIKIQDEQMCNLNLFFDILSQIHQQQSSDLLKKEESAIIERKREIRKLKIQRYREKKQSRRWDVLRYEVRKNIAKSRLRIKGRFVRE